MGNPLVTVFIPLYNTEKYIRESLESILNQTYSNLEILIVDDGSTDQSINIVNSFTDPRIRLIKNSENKGIPYTRNVGLNEANGKYMVIMDSDDVALPNRVERQVEFLEENPDIDVVGSFYEIFGGKSNKIYKTSYITPEEIKAGLLFYNRIGNPTTTIHLETLKKYNLSYNLNYFVAQDYEMWIQISKVGKLAILPEVLLKYRFGHSNITKKSLSEKTLQRKKLIDAAHKDILEFYGFKLDDNELLVYNELFNDNFQSKINENTILNLPMVLEKLIEDNKNRKIFKEEILLKMIRDAVWTSINFHNLTLSNKIKLYKQICKVKSFKTTSQEIGYIVAKHFYKSLLSR